MVYIKNRMNDTSFVEKFFFTGWLSSHAINKKQKK